MLSRTLCSPNEKVGTIGTPCLIAIRTKPLCLETNGIALSSLRFQRISRCPPGTIIIDLPLVKQLAIPRLDTVRYEGCQGQEKKERRKAEMWRRIEEVEQKLTRKATNTKHRAHIFTTTYHPELPST